MVRCLETRWQATGARHWQCPEEMPWLPWHGMAIPAQPHHLLHVGVYRSPGLPGDITTKSLDWEFIEIDQHLHYLHILHNLRTFLCCSCIWMVMSFNERHQPSCTQNARSLGAILPCSEFPALIFLRLLAENLESLRWDTKSYSSHDTKSYSSHTDFHAQITILWVT